MARALGQQSVFAALAWSLAGLTAASAMTFAAEGPLWWALVLYAGRSARSRCRSPSCARCDAVAVRTRGGRRRGSAFGIALWSIAGQLDGDGLFHLARIRKLEAFDNLRLESVNEFVDGGLHPGYAFPLWHVLMGLVAWLAGVDPGAALLHEPSVLVPVAFLVAYEAGVAILRTAWAGIAALLAAVALTGLAAGRGGVHGALAAGDLVAPPARAGDGGRLLRLREEARLGGRAHGGRRLAGARARPPDVRDLRRRPAGRLRARAARALPAASCARRGRARRSSSCRRWRGRLAAPIVRDTASHNPSAAERARGLAHYPGQVDIFSADSFRLAPEMLGRPGAVAIAALVAVPLAALASRRRWSAYVLGGSVAMLAILLCPQLFTPFSDAVSLSQARRRPFLPLAAAFAGGAAVLARLASWWALPAALGAGSRSSSRTRASSRTS